jgi:outer membrane immunogenic protein
VQHESAKAATNSVNQVGSTNMKRKMLAAAAICFCLFRDAQAADLELPPAPAAVAPGWTGFYIGANAGGSLGISSGVDSATFTTPTLVGAVGSAGRTILFSEQVRHVAPGGILGGQLGYNWQVASWVYGLEADWQWTIQKDAITAGCTSPGTLAFIGIFGTAFGQCLTDQQRLMNFGTARARAGLLVNQWLWYATGGLAWGTVSDRYTFAGSCSQEIFQCAAGGGQPGPFSSAATAFLHDRIGWTIGTGVETKLGGNWSLKLEYLYVDLGTIHDRFGVPANQAFLTQIGGATFAAGSAGEVAVSSHVMDHVVRVGLNYKM